MLPLDPETGKIAEDLVGFAECDMGITGQAVADKILHLLQKFNLDPNLLHGQGYNGAGSMAGKTKGAAAISQHSITVHYMYCASHQLNLAVVKSGEVTSVRNMMGPARSYMTSSVPIPNINSSWSMPLKIVNLSRQRKITDLSHPPPISCPLHGDDPR